MKVPIRERAWVSVSPEVLFEHITSEEGFLGFEGWGFIPGLASVVVESGSLREVGSMTRVVNADGSTHRERVRVVDPPREYGIRIFELSSAFRFLVEHVDETWRLRPERGGTAIEREFTFTLRTVLSAPLALPLGHGPFRAAMRKHHHKLARWAQQHA